MEQKNDSKGLVDLLVSAAEWIRDNQDEVKGFITWGVVNHAGSESHLYVPLDATTWKAIESARSGDETPDFERIILSAYGPEGSGYDSLVAELKNSDLLQVRSADLEEILASVEDRRYFVAICGTLPLVEYVLSAAAGKWSDPRKHLEEMKRRLNETLASDLETELLLEHSALEMVLSEIPGIWSNGKQDIGAIEEKLNRHRALHGTTSGWADADNATRALLLLAAAAKVAKSLLSPASPVSGS